MMPALGSGLAAFAFGPAQRVSLASATATATGAPAAFAPSLDRLPPLA